MPSSSESAQQPQLNSSSALMPPSSTVPQHRLSRSTSARYPSELARNPRARVPLQTRTDTYERLEDLLREAGYKETRVFTPEADEEGKAGGLGTSGVGAVVSFITGLMRAGKEEGNSSRGLGAGNDSTATQPAPPTRSPSSIASMDASTSRTSSKSEHIDIASPNRNQNRSSRPPPNPSSGAYHQLDHLHRELPHPRAAARSKPATARSQPLPPSRARAYLRHMASAPNIPQRRSATVNPCGPSSLGVGDMSQPPLPPTWLEAVAKAVLGSGVPGIHPGRPGTSDLAISSLRRTHSHRAKSKRSHSALSDRTNRAQLVPPTIILTRSHSSTAPVVSTTQVFCQSAPASRCPSRAGSIKSVRRGQRSIKRPRDAVKDRLPSLASTHVEGDALSLFLEGGHRGTKALDLEFDESSDEEGEIDLARLLVPPKRQNSIKSLRRHLRRAESISRLREVHLAASSWEEEEGGFDWRARDGNGEEDEWNVGTFDRTGTKRRRGIPNGWAQWTSSRA
ncbi:hypothetical protein NEOLEDRAFT_1176277 [Neolentinus lepideus HHB14362 ss-1]|uniref:Uncharacterized protein n=1 Tax=Neolentinus lepideus HHB14362 ss-1 TaxID=1314782 RepID=A0A165UGL9_9AGAM|nr:hypothetical protein NEOLEDRAFT_1176277 [Neolentinus lepideus HHB14362 ss-1]